MRNLRYLVPLACLASTLALPEPGLSQGAFEKGRE
jgi:hypothetical protein